MKLLSSMLLISIVLAAHPFVGEYADADFVHYEDGGLAVRLRPVEMPSTKYDHLIRKDIHLRPKL